MKNEHTGEVSAEEPFDVGVFRPEDAEGISSLFQSVYGWDYPIKMFYDAKALTEANITGEYYSIVARNGSGKVVGVEHLFRSAPCNLAYEVGAGLVAREYRRLGLNKLMLQFVFNDWVPNQANIDEVFGESVCNHPFMQQTVSGFGVVDTALEVALMPAEAYMKEASLSNRVVAILSFRSYKSRPHTVWLPHSYEQELGSIYSWLGDSRHILLASGELLTEMSSYGEMTVFDFAQVARIAMHQAGHDFANYMEELETKAMGQGVLVMQVWLKLTRPWVGDAVDILRNRGYFLGGVLPRWFDDDGLLMHKLLCDPAFEAIQLYSDQAKKIGDLVRNDWLRTRKTLSRNQ